MSYIQQEIPPISEDDLFIILNHPDAKFDYATHFHSEYELNMVLNTKGKRIVGDSVETFTDFDLVLIGPNIPHAWRGEIIQGNHVVTIQFHNQLLDFPILNKKMFALIKDLLQKSSRGVQFLENKNSSLCRKILNLPNLTGFNVSLEFLSLLYELASSPNQRLLASNVFDSESVVRESKSRRISKVCNFVNANYMCPIKLPEIAAEINMSPSALSHFFKKRTSRNLIDYVNDIRLGYATKMLFETTHSINEIAFLCGFNNIANFNRVFKKSKGQTPSEFRTDIHKILTKY
ncbi:AraC family transcriptional regulator [Bacteroidia bacterium]|nr:AraC family transcriptional regulator [Bacteroidia bacterium]